MVPVVEVQDGVVVLALEVLEHLIKVTKVEMV